MADNNTETATTDAAEAAEGAGDTTTATSAESSATHQDTATEDGQNDTEGQDADDAQASGREGQLVKEARKYRQRAQTAEAALAEQAARMDTLTRAFVGSIAKTAGIANTNTLWSLGFDAAALVSEDGTLDRTVAERAIRDFAKDNGLHINPPRPSARSLAGTGTPGGEGGSWEGAFRH